ncbi:MAG: ribonuclease HII [Pseudomonadota bacterium]
MRIPCPDYEASLTQGSMVIGVDEVGRGPLAGPVLAAAAVLRRPIEGLRDSKALSEKKRVRLTDQIVAEALIGLGAVSAQGIDGLGIEKATHLAMQRAVDALSLTDAAVVLVDGNRAPSFAGRQVITEVKADASCPSVAAASIVAKVTRDRAMMRLAERYGAYHWHTNKGYGSKAHREAILAQGVTPHHRHSFLTKILS